ncbi:tyrosine-type recombinase/integrase [Nocardia gipuzkoensis]|uniref:tyrosine-type recombinase/integrase n=1 Tax=Nocardia gipuzkoensis TaxID=2749991 RepID=UPI00237DD6BA|nr:site-specific integrase [Nocardia gipuzkoensis]MDE1674629.1 site-specific integrase [Nocardia gipuzkoensis]
MSTRTDADIATVQMMMERLGLSVADLTARAESPRTVPAFAEYIPTVLAAMPTGLTRNHYQTYWNKILAQPGWAQRRLDEPTTADLQGLCEAIRAQRVIRRSDRGGGDVVRHVIDALRRLYKHAEDNRVIDPRDNPAVRLTKPKRTRSNRRALHGDLLAQIVHVAATTGNDPELDTLLLRLHTETGCRRGGALGLRPQDLDPVQSLILLREKGGTQLWQPVSPTLMRALCRHAEQRGAAPNEQLLRARNGKPITRRRYNGLFERLGQHLPWVHTHGISIHWLRHTTTTWVERHYGPAVASEFARHSHSGSGTTGIYTTATINEVAAALAHLTGEPHPLATTDSARDRAGSGVATIPVLEGA